MALAQLSPAHGQRVQDISLWPEASGKGSGLQAFLPLKGVFTLNLALLQKPAAPLFAGCHLDPLHLKAFSSWAVVTLEVHDGRAGTH